jgi:hypothetical protein
MLRLLDTMVPKGAPYLLEGSFDKDITGATITIHYTTPAGVPGTWTGTIVTAATGAFSCAVTALQNNEAGTWLAYAEAILSTVVIGKTFTAQIVVVPETTPVT